MQYNINNYEKFIITTMIALYTKTWSYNPTLPYDKQIENVEHFKYLGAMLTNSGNSKNEIRIRLATAVSALSKLEKIWRSGEIEFKLKFRLYNSLVLSTLIYACETWTLLEESSNPVIYVH